jgi:hypothetical protein
MLGGPCHEAAWQMMNLVFVDCHDVDKSFIRVLHLVSYLEVPFDHQVTAGYPPVGLVATLA